MTMTNERRAVLLVADIADNVDKRTVRKHYPHASDEQVAEIMRCAHGVIDRMEQKIHELRGKF